MMEAVSDFLSNWNQRVIEELGGYVLVLSIYFGWRLNKVHQSIGKMVWQATERLDAIIEDVEEIKRDVEAIEDRTAHFGSANDDKYDPLSNGDEDDPDKE